MPNMTESAAGKDATDPQSSPPPLMDPGAATCDVKAEDESDAGSANGTGNEKSEDPDLTHLAMHKRRRVTRACDECRRKKIKCDGKQPCTHCTVFSYACSYDQPSTRRRNPDPHYIEHIEQRLHRAEQLLNMLIPNLDLDDPAVGVAVEHGFIPGLQSSMADNLESRKQRSQDQAVSSADPSADPQDASAQKDPEMESMVRAVGQIELDENGKWDYHGHSSGLSFMRRMREQLGDLMGPLTVATPFVKSLQPASHVDSPRHTGNPGSPTESTSILPVDLPPQHLAKITCSNAVNEVAVLLRVVHGPTFWTSFNRIYAVPASQYDDEDHKFLPLLYSVLAVGTVYGNESDNEYEPAIEIGSKYFKAARQLLDIADCRDLTAVQAVLFIIYFLQASAKLSTCYVYVGIVLRSALRMGLHRSLNMGFNPLECEMRKRVFWTIRKMDIYIGAMLGLPQTLIEDDIDQDDPVEVDDEYISAEGIKPMPEGTVPFMTAFNVHTRLCLIIPKIVRNVYPIRPKTGQSATEKSYTVPFSVVSDIEKDLEEWKNSLPPGLSPSHHEPRLVRVQQMLRLEYAFVQSILYRPFLHFVGSAKRCAQIDPRAYACASSYINVSRNLIHLATQMQQKNLLNGAFWVIMYMTYFSIMSLVYFAAENPKNPTTEALLKDALEGKAVLAAFSKRSMAADRCTATLDTAFKGLPEWIREGRPPAAASRKRRKETLNSKQHTDRQGTKVYAVSSTEATRDATDSASPMAATPNLPVPGLDTSPFASHQALDTKGALAPNNQAFASMPLLLQQQQRNSSPLYAGMSAQQHFVSQPGPDGLYHAGHAGLQDVSPAMFPTSEPFTGPQQPLTAFEEQHGGGHNIYDYTERHPQQPPPLHGHNGMRQDTRDMSGQYSAGPDGFVPQRSAHPMVQPGMHWEQQPMHGAAGYMPAQQLVIPDVNLNDIFGGGDWNSLLVDQGYRHQG